MLNNKRHYLGDSHPSIPLNVYHDEGSRNYTIIDSIDEVMSAYLIHEIHQTNETDRLIKERKLYSLELREVPCVDEDGELILDDDGNEIKTFIEQQVTGEEYIPEPITINFGTVGGSAYSSIAIMEAINNSKTPVKLIMYETVMSGGTIISCAKCHKVATKYTRWLLHNLSTYLGYNNLTDIRDSVAESENLEKTLRTIYEENTKIPKKVLDSIFKNSKDLYLSSEQALEYGFISEII